MKKNQNIAQPQAPRHVVSSPFQQGGGLFELSGNSGELETE